MLIVVTRANVTYTNQRQTLSYHHYFIMLIGLLLLLTHSNGISLLQGDLKQLEQHQKSSKHTRGLDESDKSDRAYPGIEVLLGSEPPSRPIVHWTNPLYKPYFDTSLEDRNVTAQLGKSTFLKCRIKQITDETVSWVRQKDLHIISAGPFIYTSDQRFEPKHVENTDEWYLHIKYVQIEDSGTYECQISTEPKKSLPFYLNVIEAKSEILGGPSIYYQSKDTINLTCIINQKASPPLFVYWFKDNQVLGFLSQPADPTDYRISVSTVKGPISTSILEIRNARPSDSGNYSCRPVPQYVDPANVTVTVLNGDNPAAMQHNSQTGGVTLHSTIMISFIALSFHKLWLPREASFS